MLALAAGASVAAASALMGLSYVDNRRTRLLGSGMVLAAALGVMLAQPFKPHAMGDYSVFTRDRSLFEDRFRKVFEFQYHLGAALVHYLDKAFGSTAHSPVDAFHTLARLASIVFVLGLALLAFREGVSSRVVRYLALVFAAPPTLLVFGYAEFGYLPGVFIVTATPLALIGLERGSDGLVVTSAVLLGVGAALHGFGLVAAGFLLLVALLWERNDLRRMFSRLVQVVGGVSFGWLSWMALYFIFLDFKIKPGHSNEFPLRPLFHTRVDRPHFRHDYAVFSHTGLRDILFEFIILGVFVTVFVLISVRGGRLWESIVVASVPGVLFVIFFWPVQGLGNDTDFLGAAFPSLYASGWLASSSKRVSLIAVAALCLSQLALLYVVHGHRFVHSRDF